MIQINNILGHVLGRREPETEIILPRGTKTDPSWRTIGLTDPLCNTSGLIGLEIELEQSGRLVELYSTSLASRFFNLTDDNSLRNQGIELVSKPLYKQYIHHGLVTVDKLISESNAVATQRCGLHMHLNCLHMPANKFVLLLLCLLIVEESLYKQTGNRYDNGFCVPHRLSNYTDILHACNLAAIESGMYFRNISNFTHKYSGINVKPLVDKGTIEFRMFAGKTQPSDYASIFSFILQLQEGILKDPRPEKDFLKEILSLNTESAYFDFFRSLAGNTVNAITTQNFLHECNSSMVHVKRLVSKLLGGF